MNDSDIIVLNIGHILKILYHKLVIIILVGVLAGAATFGFSKFVVKPTYQSSASFYVNGKSSSEAISSADISLSKSLVSTYIVILKTNSTLNAVIEKGGFNMSPATLSSKISASAVNGTEIFKVSVTDYDPETATRIVQTISEVLPTKISKIVIGSSVKVVDEPGSDVVINTANYKKNTIIGAIVGIIIACAIIIIKDVMDDTIKTEEFLMTNFASVPILANIPDPTKESSSYYYSSQSKYARAYADKKKESGK